MPRTWETDRLLLREFGPEHASAVRDYGLRSREFQAPWDPVRPADFWDLPVVAARLAGQVSDGEHHSALCLCLTLKDDPERVIGVANLRNIVRGALMGCHLGYGLAPDALGHGYMTEAVRRTLVVAFCELGLHRVEANIIPRNVRSLAVVERAGFIREGFSARYLRIAGKWEDHIRFARINDAMV